MEIDISFLVDKQLPFLRKNKKLEILNLFQFFQQRFGIGKKITKNIIIFSGVHFSIKLKKYIPNLINQETRYVFLNHEEELDIPLERKMMKDLQKNIELYNYRGSRYLLRLPLHGQRRR